MSGTSGFSDLTPENSIDGGTDGTSIGNTGDRLKVDADITSIGSGTYPTMQCPEVDSFRNGNISLPNFASGYGDIYSYSGSGEFYEFIINPDSESIWIALEIDGAVCFEVHLAVLEDIGTSSSSVPPAYAMFGYNDVSHALRFSPRYPITFNTSLKIVGKADSSTTSRDIEEYFIVIRNENKTKTYLV